MVHTLRRRRTRKARHTRSFDSPHFERNRRHADNVTIRFRMRIDEVVERRGGRRVKRDVAALKQQGTANARAFSLLHQDVWMIRTAVNDIARII